MASIQIIKVSERKMFNIGIKLGSKFYSKKSMFLSGLGVTKIVIRFKKRAMLLLKHYYGSYFL